MDIELVIERATQVATARTTCDVPTIKNGLSLLPVAEAGSVREFGRRLDQERRAVERGDGMDKLERQRRKVEFRDRTDADGMYCFAGRTDPLSGLSFKAKIDAEVRALFAKATPRPLPTTRC